jgi:tRNA modification GTPase
VGARSERSDRSGATIVALATAPGRGALALVRLSGRAARAIAARVGAPHDLSARVAARATLHACDTPAVPLDDALLTWFPAAQSPIGEDLVEFSVHGGSYVSTALVAALVAAGAVPALPGEFTERAVRHGKLDLIQAEAVADLIDARSRAMHRAALRQLTGALSARLLQLREALLGVDALIAYELDFPEEDDGPQPRARAVHAANAVLEALDALRATMPMAELGREGVTIVLAGAPNAGKSSLFNALLGDRRAIVSEVPGTTRDAIEALVDADPLPWRLVDTAGLRESDDLVERLGLEVSQRWLRRAQVVLVCGDSAAALEAASAAVRSVTEVPQILVRTKDDHGSRTEPLPDAAVRVSAHTGAGLGGLRVAVASAVAAAYPEPSEDHPAITRARHAAALERAAAEVTLFRDAWAADALPAPVAATHLRAAILALEELTGAIDVEDVLERVFRSFCVGK